jgi:hypothetical protein
MVQNEKYGALKRLTCGKSNTRPQLSMESLWTEKEILAFLIND